MVKRVETLYMTTPADTNEHDANLTGPDTYQQQNIKRVFVGIDTAGVAVIFKVTGDTKATVDCSRFAPGNTPVEVEMIVPPAMPLVVGLQDLAGNAHTNVPIVVEYEVTNP